MPDAVTELKDCLEALEKLKVIRREIKAKLAKDDLDAEKEQTLAKDLHDILAGIVKLESRKLDLASRIA